MIKHMTVKISTNNVITFSQGDIVDTDFKSFSNDVVLEEREDFESTIELCVNDFFQEDTPNVQILIDYLTLIKQTWDSYENSICVNWGVGFDCNYTLLYSIDESVLDYYNR